MGFLDIVLSLDPLGRRVPYTSHPPRREHPCVSVVIPTLNEERNLPHVLPSVPDVIYRMPECVNQVILVNGRSTDNTAEVARDLIPGIEIIQQTSKGKGNALQLGFAAATGDIVVMMDADGSADPDEIQRFVEALETGADFAKGSRFMGNGSSSDITPLRRLGNWALSMTANILFGAHFTDLCYGYNAFWRDSLDRFDVDASGFEVETELNLRAWKAGLNIVEVPSIEYDRIHGESNLNTWRDGWRVLTTIVRERLDWKAGLRGSALRQAAAQSRSGRQGERQT
jgi:glycosyltransferase involved in cell wall biosynthesis